MTTLRGSPGPRSGNSGWRIDSNLLRDEDSVQQIGRRLRESLENDLPITPQRWDSLKEEWRTTLQEEGKARKRRLTAQLNGTLRRIRIIRRAEALTTCTSDYLDALETTYARLLSLKTRRPGKGNDHPVNSIYLDPREGGRIETVDSVRVLGIHFDCSGVAEMTWQRALDRAHSVAARVRNLDLTLWEKALAAKTSICTFANYASRVAVNQHKNRKPDKSDHRESSLGRKASRGQTYSAPPASGRREFTSKRYLRKHVRRHLGQDGAAPVPVMVRRPPATHHLSPSNHLGTPARPRSTDQARPGPIRRRAIRLVLEGPTQSCDIPLAELQDHCGTWAERAADTKILFERPAAPDPVDTTHFTADDVLAHLRKAENTAPGSDRLTYNHLEIGRPRGSLPIGTVQCSPGAPSR
ncbi:hypothetical protein MTO96_029513 [Rhipicephalus appendiculatus]